MSFFGHERNIPIEKKQSMDVEDAESHPLLDFYSVQYAPSRGDEDFAMRPTMVHPISRLTPVSEEAGSDNYTDDEDPDTLGVEAEDDINGERVSQTAAERMAEKRKMKRFRLTRNQTRFLLNEFAHHAHPDAARRERLSKEIPGWTARQVQVWFQNRRAKLKRLTIDDQERMIRSRAGPPNFDMDYHPQSPFETSHSSIVPHAASSPVITSPPSNSSMIYPVMMQNSRYDSDDDQTVFPIGMGHAFANFSSPTSPVSVANAGEGRISYDTETVSPPLQFHSTNSVLLPHGYLSSHHRSGFETHEQTASRPEYYSGPRPVPGSPMQYPNNFQPLLAQPRPLLPFERNSSTHFDQYLEETIDINGLQVGHVYDDACEEAPRLDRPYHNPREHRFQRSTGENEPLCLRQFTADIAFQAR